VLAPIKTKLKPPETKCLKLKCDILLSTSAFNFNLRRYDKDTSGSHPCQLCPPIPLRAVYSDPGAAGAITAACPYKCTGAGLRKPHCVTRMEAAVAAVGGPMAAAAALAAAAVLLTLPVAAVYGRGLNTSTFRLDVSAFCGTVWCGSGGV